MKVTLCNGGLGNQTFQYIFSRYMELAGEEPCYLDDSAFCGREVEHNGFEMRRVFPNCRPRLLSEYFSEDVWGYIMQKKAEGISLVQTWKDIGESFAMVAETTDFQYDGNVIRVPANGFHPWLAWAGGNIYYHGYWINRGYLRGEFQKILRGELAFAPLTGEKNLSYEKRITETNSVALHVRRGDFVKLGWDKPAEAYSVAVGAMRKAVPEPCFFIFSDAQAWCRENLEKMGIGREEAIFVEGNRGADSYMDMQLMSYCKNMILATTSSFSYLSALLNRNESMLVVNLTGREV